MASKLVGEGDFELRCVVKLLVFFYRHLNCLLFDICGEDIKRPVSTSLTVEIITEGIVRGKGREGGGDDENE